MSVSPESARGAARRGRAGARPHRSRRERRERRRLDRPVPGRDARGRAARIGRRGRGRAARCATRRGVAVVPQGGNTGLVGGSVPLHGELVLDLRRLDAIGPVDPRTGPGHRAGGRHAGAACSAHAHDAGWQYGVDLGAARRRDRRRDDRDQRRRRARVALRADAPPARRHRGGARRRPRDPPPRRAREGQLRVTTSPDCCAGARERSRS